MCRIRQTDYHQKHHTNSIQTLIDPPKKLKGKGKQIVKGYTVQRVIHGRHHTGESNSVTVQLLGLAEFLGRVASVVCDSVCDISRSLSRRCDEFLVSRNRIIVGTASVMTPPVMAQDLLDFD